MHNFLSDNVTSAHPAILKAVCDTNAGKAMPYGDDEWTTRLDHVFSELFDTDVAVIPCLSGTAANALALSLVADPLSGICAHHLSHINNDECTAPELFTGGARVLAVGGDTGKLTPTTLAPTVARRGDLHAVQPAVVSATQATELGTVYSLDELDAIGSFAREHDLAFHMDGARLANAVVANDCSPAAITHEQGVNLLSFGGTKNGCLAAEAIILFEPRRATEARIRAKRAGQLLSKMRFVAAQLLAYVEDDLWLDNARHANAAAQHLHAVLSRQPDIECERPPATNMVYIRQTPEAMARLDDAGIQYNIEAGGIRLCTAWNTPLDEIDRLFTD